METDSKNKRGRPSVSRKLYGNDEFMRYIDGQFKELESKRSKTNMLYFLEGMDTIQRHIGEDNFEKVFVTSGGKYKGKCIVEQIGRMRVQNRYDEDSCFIIIDKAIEYLNDGYTVRTIEQWIRQGRKNNEW